MKKNLIIITILALFAASCASDKGSENDPASELAKSKKELVELKHKIRMLEEEVSKNGAGKDGILIRAKELKTRAFEHFFQVTGYVEPVQDAYISPEVNGQIKEIYVQEGQRVKKGDKLIRLNTSITESTIREVKTSLDLARTVYLKQKNLWDQEIGSEIEYLQAKNNVESLESKLETLQSQLDMALIKSPFKGIVDEIFVKRGELAIPGAQMMQLVNLSEVFINADVSEKFLSSIQEGDMVEVSFPAYPDMGMLNLPVYRTGEVINPQNRTFALQLKLKNKNENLKPNMLAMIDIRDYANDSALVVPSMLIRKDLKGEFIYKVMQKDGEYYASKNYITSGRSYNNETMVLEGLDVGDQVITEGYQIVSDGIHVAVEQ